MVEDVWGSCTVHAAIGDARLATFLTARDNKIEFLMQALSSYECAEKCFPDGANFTPSLLEKQAVIHHLTGQKEKADQLKGEAVNIRKGWKRQGIEEDQIHIQQLPNPAS